MKIRILILLVFLVSNVFSQGTIKGRWSTRSNYPNARIVVGDLDGSYIMKINNISTDDTDHYINIEREGKSTIQITEGSETLMSVNKRLTINYPTTEIFSFGTWELYDPQKKLKGTLTQWNIGTITNKRATTVLDTDMKFLFALDISAKSEACKDILVNIKVDGVMIKLNGEPFPFVMGNTILGYGKKIEVIVIAGNCPYAKPLNGSMTIYE